jgi:hypothetical protein
VYVVVDTALDPTVELVAEYPDEVIDPAPI